MPTANEYRRVARTLNQARDAVATLLEPVHAALEPSPFEAGGRRLGRTVGATVAVGVANLAGIRDELEVQITEALRRQHVCERYAAAVRRYRNSTDPDRSYPARPATWADDG